MKLGDGQLKRQLQEEMQQIAFSSVQKGSLCSHMLQALRGNELAQHKLTLAVRLRDLWNGSVEIPLPVAVALLVAIPIGLIGHVTGIYVVDQTTASLLLHVNNEAANTINQGVSVL